MILESLLELVETLKARLDEHAHEFRDSEALTRYALIDPLLRELGWDTEDPNVVRPEYRVPNGNPADYVLFADREPAIVVESKKLGEPLGTALDQGLQNADSACAEYFLLTDGRRYELYQPGKNSACGSFDLRGSFSAEGCLKALAALWGPSVQSGSVGTGHESVLVPHDDSPELLQTKVTDIPPPLPTNHGYNWEPLAEITVEKRPVELRLPDGTKARIKRWNDLLTETTRWLVDNDRLDRKSLPIMRRGNPKNTTVVVSNEPTLKGEEVSGVYVRTDYNPGNCVLNAIVIIKRAACCHPSQFSVRFT